MTVTRIDLGSEYLGGIAKPQTADVGKFAVVRLDSLQRPNLAYETQVASVADDTFATTLAPSLRGVGLTVDSSGNLAPRQRPRAPQLRDYFVSGSVASGAIGALGWNLLGTGTPALTRANGAFASGTTSRIQLATSGSVNDRSVLALGETETRTVVRPTELAVLQCAWSFNANTASKRMFFGLSDDFGNAAASMVNGIGIYYDSAVSPNYQLISRSASSGSPVVTALAVPSNTSELISIVQATPGTFVFYSGNTALGAIASGVALTTGMGVGFRLETLTGSAKNQLIGYFGLEVVGGGSLDDDTFLEA